MPFDIGNFFDPDPCAGRTIWHTALKRTDTTGAAPPKRGKFHVIIEAPAEQETCAPFDPANPLRDYNPHPAVDLLALFIKPRRLWVLTEEEVRKRVLQKTNKVRRTMLRCALDYATGRNNTGFAPTL